MSPQYQMNQALQPMSSGFKDNAFNLQQHRNFGYQLKEREAPAGDRKMKMVGNQDLMLPDIYSPTKHHGFSEARGSLGSPTKQTPGTINVNLGGFGMRTNSVQPTGHLIKGKSFYKQKVSSRDEERLARSRLSQNDHNVVSKEFKHQQVYG